MRWDYRFQFLQLLLPALLPLPVFPVERPPLLHGLEGHVDVDVTVPVARTVVRVVAQLVAPVAAVFRPLIEHSSRSRFNWAPIFYGVSLIGKSLSPEGFEKEAF